MAIEDAPPEGDSNRPMWSMLNEELRRAIEDEGEMVEPAASSCAGWSPAGSTAT
jgi:hypothetical protein